MESMVLTKGSDVARKMECRDKITGFAQELMKFPGVTKGDNANCPLKHHFTDGIYTREIFMPAGTVCVGKIHRHEHPNFLMKGKVTVVTEEGGIEELQAPRFMISPAGTQRALYIHEDCVWVTVHNNPDNLTDLKELEELIIAKSFDEITDVIESEVL